MINERCKQYLMEIERLKSFIEQERFHQPAFITTGSVNRPSEVPTMSQPTGTAEVFRAAGPKKNIVVFLQSELGPED